MLRKKSGEPLLETFTNPLYQHSLSAIVADINGSFPLLSLDEASCGRLVWLVICIMERHLGKGGKHKHTLMKFPMALFNDTKFNGSLHLILKSFLCKPVEFWESVLEGASDHDVHEGLQTLVDIETKLWEAGFISYPKIFVGSSVPVTHVPELRKIVSKHKGEIVKGEENATHIIEWDEEVDNLPEELPEEFLRPTEFLYQTNLAKVHWWYHPDSYDEYIPLAEIDDPSEPPDSHYIPAQWRLCCRWIRDVEAFNEWGNEVDYELDVAKEEEEDSGLSASAKKKRARGRKSVSGKSKDLYQGTQVVPTSNPATEKMMPSFLPPSVDPGVEVLRVVDVSAGKVDLKDEARPSSATAAKRKASGAAESPASKKSATVSGVGPPSWFRRDAVHDCEKLYLPEFFDGSVPTINESLYMFTRTAIISEYTRTPHVYLSATVCRKNHSGDARSIIAIHDFLDSHGVINYAVDASERPPKIPLLLPFSESIMRPVVLGQVSGEVKLSSEMQAKLLDAVSECATGDWDSVARLMGDWTPAQCLRRFASLRLDGFDSPNQQATPMEMEVTDSIKHESTKREMLLEYVALRMQAVEHKIQLLKSVDSLLDLEQERLLLDKRDNQALRSQIAFQQAQQAATPGAFFK